MMRVLYNLSTSAYFLLIRGASFFNSKANEWVTGRRGFKTHIINVKNKEPLIWFHCASLGEFEQGKPVMEEFKKRHPSWKLLLTFFSPSGYNVRKDYELADYVEYLPEETKQNISIFLQAYNPRIAVFVKYEFWYGFMHALWRRNIPLIFVSSSFRAEQIFFKPWGTWFLKQLKVVEMFFVQDEPSKLLLQNAGITKVEVSGDTRYDRVLDSVVKNEDIPFVSEFKNGQKILVFGSAWQKEAEFALKFLEFLPNGWKVVYAPHEINDARIDAFTRKLSVEWVSFTSLTMSNAKSSKVLVVDTVGHLARLYKYANLAVIGGGFNDGIHNILEPLAFGVPVAFGPKHKGFMEGGISIAQDIGYEIESFNGLHSWLMKCINDPSVLEGKRNKAKKFVQNNSGATQKVSQFLNKIGQIISCQIC